MSSLREQLEQVRESVGSLTPRIVVDVARAVDHPLHARLEWDDSIAGERYRLDQAHRLIQSVRVPYVKDDRPLTTRFYEVTPSESGGVVYEPVEEIALDPVKRRLLLAQAQREWRTLYARYKDLGEFIDMVQASVGADEYGVAVGGV